MNLLAWIYIFVGGGLGSMLRFGISRWYLLHHESTVKFPWPTFWANMLASFLLGAIIFWDEENKLAEHYKYLLAVGFCGGFSTFSTFSLELLHFLKKDEWVMAGIYLASSCLLGICFVYAGKKILTII